MHSFTVIKMIIAIVLAPTVLSGCSPEAEKGLAQKAVDEFHSRLDAEAYHNAYNATDPELRKSMTESDFTMLLQTIHKKLGNVQRSTNTSYMARTSIAEGVLISLRYDTEFARGKADEHFVWRVRNSISTLVGYNITSQALTER